MKSLVDYSFTSSETMYYSFWTPSKKENEVKSLIRTFSSLRFTKNPLTVEKSTNFCLIGDVEEMNSFGVQLDEILAEPPEEKKPGLFQRILRFLTFQWS